MDDFTTKIGEKNMFGLVQGASNAIAPGKRPLSSMSPTIVTRNNRVFLVLGSPGGSRIITASLQAALNIIDYGMLPQEAVDAPRIHHQWLPDEVYYEQNGLSFDTLKLLRQRGYKMTEQTPWGATELIMVAPTLNVNEKAADSGNDSAVSGQLRPGYLYGANDMRRPAGAAVGF
ncbi:gamma-glutamyltranspeptidase [Erwinia amylovora MR1]|nr:gamma-glutamyltranspeptidase [Erwinia amylovora MR1]